MTGNDIEVTAALAGLGASIAFAQTSRHLTIGPLSRVVSLIALPLAIGFTWRIALAFHWWTVIIFLMVSLVVGALNGMFARKAGRNFLYSVQPIQAAIIIFATVACWIPTMIIE